MKNQSKSIKQHSLIRNSQTLLLGQRVLLCLLAGLGTTLLSSAGWGQTCRDGCATTNTYQGIDALLNSGGVDNTGFGYNTLQYNFFGDANTAMGAHALAVNNG